MIVAFDVWLLGFLSTWRSAVGDLLFSAITWTGSLWLLLPLSILIGVFRQQALVPLSILAAAVASHLLKLSVARARPDLHEVLVTMPADLSFPSAHSAQAAACAAALVLAVPSLRRASLLFLLVVWVLVVGISRLYLQVHWPSDVLAGWAIGILCAVCVRQEFHGHAPERV